MRYATHARPTFKSSRYVKSGIGWFSPVESSAGVEKPPRRPSTAMNSESCRMERSTATQVTSTSSPKVTVVGIRFHSAWAAKNVAKRMAMAAASSALAVTGYFRAALRSHTTSSVVATITPMATRTGGWSHPWSIE